MFYGLALFVFASRNAETEAPRGGFRTSLQIAMFCAPSWHRGGLERPHTLSNTVAQTNAKEGERHGSSDS